MMADIDGSWGLLHRETYQFAIGKPELSSILLGGTSCLAWLLWALSSCLFFIVPSATSKGSTGESVKIC
jgi:hypothetical protein